MKQAKIRRANGKVYYQNSHAQFHVPVTSEGWEFIRLANKFLNPEHFHMWKKYRGPHRPSSDTKRQDAHSMAVYIRVKPIPQTKQRMYNFWLAEAARRKAGQVPKKCPDTESLYPSLKFIQDCANVTTRMAMILCYGLDRYMIDAGATVIDKVMHKGQLYELLTMKLDDPQGGRGTPPKARIFWTTRMLRPRPAIRALKMVCPSTGAVYIHPVPPDIDGVRYALDWMFGVNNYLGTIGSES